MRWDDFLLLSFSFPPFSTLLQHLAFQISSFYNNNNWIRTFGNGCSLLHSNIYTNWFLLIRFLIFFWVTVVSKFFNNNELIWASFTERAFSDSQELPTCERRLVLQQWILPCKQKPALSTARWRRCVDRATLTALDLNRLHKLCFRLLNHGSSPLLDVAHSNYIIRKYWEKITNE